MNETGNALRSCMEQLLLVRDEKERIVIEAANKISSEKMKTHDLQHKFNDANKQFEKAIAENCNLRNIVDTKEKLIKDLKESKAHSDQKLADTTARLEFSQKQCTSLKYEVCMLQEELEIRNKEREYDLKSIHAAQKQRQESMKKIGALEAECQRLRTMVQKRLPGPTALAKMKDEVKRQGTSSAENGSRRPRAVVQPQPRARHTFSEGYQVKLQELGEENRHLIRQLLAQKESDLQFVQPKYVDEACKPSILQRQHEELCGSHVLTENKHPERMVSTLAKMDHSRSGKQHVSRIRSRGRRITGSDIQFLVDPLEIEKLERASRPSSATHQCVDTPDTDSKMVVSETVHIDLVPDDGFSDKYPEWIQDVLEVIIHKHQVSKISVARIIDEVAHALRNEISAKGNHDAHLSYDRAEIDKIVATLTERVSNMVERSTKNNVTRFRSFFHEKYELTLQLGHLVHICSDILDGKANLGQLIVEVCLILEWIVSQCFLRLDLNAVDSVTNNSEGNESLRTLNIHEKDAMQSTKSEMAFGMQQEKQQELIETTEGQITIVTLDNHSQIELTCKLDEDLLAVIQGQGDSCQEKHPVYHETESSASDGRKEEIEEEGKQLKTTSAISAATKKLAECQKTITAPSKQLHALESPVNADASDKEKCGTLPPPVANLFAEADPKPEDLSPPTSEEATRIKEHSVSEPNATEKSPEHEAPGTGAKARKSGTTPIALRPMVPKSPRASVSADARKKKRRASLLSRLVFRKKA